jgi:hypothetical protein
MEFKISASIPFTAGYYSTQEFGDIFTSHLTSSMDYITIAFRLKDVTLGSSGDVNLYDINIKDNNSGDTLIVNFRDHSGDLQYRWYFIDNDGPNYTSSWVSLTSYYESGDLFLLHYAFNRYSYVIKGMLSNVNQGWDSTEVSDSWRFGSNVENPNIFIRVYCYNPASPRTVILSLESAIYIKSAHSGTTPVWIDDWPYPFNSGFETMISFTNTSFQSGGSPWA